MKRLVVHFEAQDQYLSSRNKLLKDIMIKQRPVRDFLERSKSRFLKVVERPRKIPLKLEFLDVKERQKSCDCTECGKASRKLAGKEKVYTTNQSRNPTKSQRIKELFQGAVKMVIQTNNIQKGGLDSFSRRVRKMITKQILNEKTMRQHTFLRKHFKLDLERPESHVKRTMRQIQIRFEKPIMSVPNSPQMSKSIITQTPNLTPYKDRLRSNKSVFQYISQKPILPCLNSTPKPRIRRKISDVESPYARSFYVRSGSTSKSKYQK